MNEQGLTDEMLNTALTEDIKAKPQNRLGELTLAYKLKGKLSEHKEATQTNILIVTGESNERYKQVKDID